VSPPAHAVGRLSSIGFCQQLCEAPLLFARAMAVLLRATCTHRGHIALIGPAGHRMIGSRLLFCSGLCRQSPVVPSLYNVRARAREIIEEFHLLFRSSTQATRRMPKAAVHRLNVLNWHKSALGRS
jgi:hypothetical protein